MKKPRPKRPEILTDLLNSKLFEKVGSSFYKRKLRLIKSNFILHVPIFLDRETKPEDLKWTRYKPRTYLDDDFAFYRNGQFCGEPEEVNTSDVFDEAPKKVVGRLAFYLGHLPRR